jgi:hypothetical protein
MWQVLLANAIWLVILGLWCVLYFAQAKIDRKKRLASGRRH